MRRRNAIPRNKRQAHAKERALAAVARMRREGVSLSVAAKVEGTSPNTVRRYAGTALRQKCPGGHCQVTPFDRIARPLNFLTPGGQIPVTVSNSRIATMISEHLKAVKKYRNTGDTSALAPFRGKALRAGSVLHEFVTDPKTLDKLGHAGFLKIEGLYRVVHGPQ
jgi:hypothetical protein